MASHAGQPARFSLPGARSVLVMANSAISNVLREDDLTGHIGVAGVYVFLVIQVCTKVYAMDSGGDGLGSVT